MEGVSRTFLEWLNSYDPRLKPRYDREKECFVIETRDRQGKLYTVVLAHQLDNRVKNFIIDRDMQRLGGAFNYLKAVENMEQDAQRKVSEVQQSQHHDFVSDAYEHMKYVQNEKFFQYPAGA